jgi:hypothetical protein
MATTTESFEGDAAPGKVAQDIFDATEASLGACREALAERNPTARGKLWSAFDIDEQGRAHGVHVQIDEVGDDAFTRCVASALGQAVLPATDQGKVVFEIRLYDEAELRGAVIGVVQ